MSKPGPQREVTDMDLIKLLPEREDNPPAAGAGDIANQVSISETRVRKLLNDLADEGRIQRGRINGQKNVIYWLD